MRVPNARAARIRRGKILDYLLSATHEAGLDKASVFGRLGYVRGDWPRLASDLLLHLSAHPVVAVQSGPHGTKYVVRGSLRGPTGESRIITAVWIVRHGENFPRLVTAYPGRSRGGVP